ncbi:MAG: short-chain dehydrogenase [Candidatus Altiarchaeales archaeon WOR_SM1_86-2]|nr:MAG: short-chain dehydrogenase [Candidatus Altiarchaeales archaeon WOR_SM1_86-2]ODS39963.1 MAG: short-chain dehydrogenase [Candidatus Altiarchaeales archaeon WOR_SM1_79]
MNNKETALITGASSGIGYELSRLFAQDGYNLVLVARNKEVLDQLADELEKEFEISTKVISKDLSVAASPKEIFDELRQESIRVDVMVNNAGFNVYGNFSETDLKKELQMIQVHIVSLTRLTKIFLPWMLKQGCGRILNVCSTGSFVPCPLDAVYCATKAYVLSFSEAIAEELQGTGVTVTALCPGVTWTRFQERAQMPRDLRLFKFGAMDAKTVAETGYRGLMKGKRIVIPGIYNKLQVFLLKFTPGRMATKMTKYYMDKR